MVRMGQQLAGFTVVWLVVSMVVTAPPLVETASSLGLSDLVSAFGALIAVVIGVLVVHRWLGGPSLIALGSAPRPGWYGDVTLGLASGPLQFGVVLLVGVFLGLVRADAGRFDAADFLVGGLAMFCVAAGEELLMRGVLLRQLARGWGIRHGVAASSLVFALLHLPNLLTDPLDGALISTALLVLALLGVLWAIAALQTQSLWLPTALHLSWNAAQGYLFGLPISGHPVDGLVTVTLLGPSWISGGEFGPEGGLTGLLAAALGAAVLSPYLRRAGGRGQGD